MIAVYQLRGVQDYFYGYMLPSTGQLRWFSLQALSARVHPAPAAAARIPRTLPAPSRAIPS